MSVYSVGMAVVLAAMFLTGGCVGTTDDFVRPPIPDKPDGDWTTHVSFETENWTKIWDSYYLRFWGNDTADVVYSHSEARDNWRAVTTNTMTGPVTQSGSNYTITTQQFGNYTLTISANEWYWEADVLTLQDGTELTGPFYIIVNTSIASGRSSTWQPPEKPVGEWCAEIFSGEIITGMEIRDGYRIIIRENDTAVVAHTHVEKNDDRETSLTKWVNGTVAEEGTNFTVETEEYGNFTLEFSREGIHWEPGLLITPEGT